MPTPKMANSPAPHVASSLTSATEYAAAHVGTIVFAVLALVILGATLLAVLFWRRRCDGAVSAEAQDLNGGPGS